MSAAASDIVIALVNGVSWGLITALMALGLSFIFGLMGIINVAHADFFMMGSFLALYFVGQFGNLFYGIPIILLIGFLCGLPFERLVFRGFEEKPAYTCLLSIGLAYILQQMALAAFGGGIYTAPNPFPLTVTFLGVSYPGIRLLLAGVAIGLLAGLWLILYRTNYGLKIRAVMSNREMADALGIDVNRLRMVSFGIGSALAFAAGGLAAPLLGIYFLMGRDILPLAFMVVVIGGLGTLRGTFFAALLLVLLENLLSLAMTPTETRVISLVIMLVVIVLRVERRR